MELTQGCLQHLLEDLSSCIQTFLFLLGLLLVVTPLALTFSLHDFALRSSPRPISPLQMKCHHLYKRFCHYSHMWILVALEELGVFGLLDTLFYWLPLANNTYNDDDDAPVTATTTLFPGTSPSTDFIHLNGGFQQHQQTGLTRQLANVCIRGPENTQDYPLLVSGLVNTGNTCYLNSVLQALSSLPRLQIYLDGINNQYTNQHLPVTRSLYKTLRLLSRPLLDEINTKNLAFRPIDIVSAVNVNHRVINREQQDAHELFQLLSGALEAEELVATKGRHADKGLKNLLLPHGPSISSASITTTINTILGHHSTADAFSTTVTTEQHHKKLLRLNNPMTGLLANRLSCTTCGYTEAIRHFSFNNIQLTLPQTASTTLYSCLEQLTTMEYLDDVSCRKCSMNGLAQRMDAEVERLRQKIKLCGDGDDMDTLATTLVQVEMQHRDLVHQLAEGGSIDDEQAQKYKKQQQHVPYQVHSGQSTKQVMLAKPPKVLCLHVSRSTFHSTGVIYKNKCQLEFPEYLDMDQFCTNGTLLTTPDQPISQQQSNSNNNLASHSPEEHTLDTVGGVKYKLMSIIVHYGSHSCGHFIAYKRRVVADGCGCDKCGSMSQEHCALRASDTWYRISDENVDLCTIDEVLQANPYMLLYESIDPSPISPPSITYNHSNLKAISPMARILISTENNSNNDDEEILQNTTRIPPIPIVKPSSTPLSSSCSTSSMSSLSSSSSSTSSTSLSSTTASVLSSPSSSATSLRSSPSPSNSTDLLAVSPSSCASQKPQKHIGSSHLVQRNKDRRKLDWQESTPPLVIY